MTTMQLIAFCLSMSLGNNVLHFHTGPGICHVIFFFFSLFKRAARRLLSRDTPSLEA